MASNYTEHYKLNQWELSDSVMMAEFNEDNVKIEQALLELKAGLPKFQVGSFTIEKSPTAEKPCTLTFDFPPQLVIIVQSIKASETLGTLVLLQGVTQQAYANDPKNYLEYKADHLYVAWEGNSVSFYPDYYDLPKTDYHYLAIG